ncbi:MAG: thiosulfate oxidation carrier complex protein SoxZ [Methylibium sp.]|uniref:thiosulfate oxidation carrier complex protein SoxZ n=1 Tax=Methylibium sp. TaxID=2067992 RepID=UPI001859BD64|nr:thiosulfate oxidation carrier complex protein SoxZ [Methylibium sp.]MBA3597092.1 thiosulfate oxidation carrier complex protein SoxZ [Methylibium sp.]
MARTLITVPKAAKRGEIIEIRTLIAHPMETGHRSDSEGRRLPRDILRRFVCHYGDEVVFEAELFPAISANPYLVFTTVAVESGTLRFTWEGDNGFAQTETAEIAVT